MYRNDGVVAKHSYSLGELTSVNTEPRAANRTYNFSQLKRYVVVFALFNLCVAQPLYDLLSRNSEFFVVHNAKPIDLICLVLILTILLPAVLILLEHAVTLLNKKIGTVLHLTVVSMLFICGLLPFSKRFFTVSDNVLISITITTVLVLVLAYWRLSLVKKFLLYCSIGVVIFPVLFLFFSPVQKLMWGAEDPSAHTVAIKNPVPIVLILFDEFKTMALLNGDRTIDPVRYPHFAEFSNHSYWFPHATTAYPYTTVAIPAILSGKYPDDTKRIPTTGDYPNTLFSLLADSHDIYAYESATEICPGGINKGIDTRHGFVDRWKVLYTDVSIVFMHVIAPDQLRNALPPISWAWKGFGGKGDGWDTGKGWKNATGDRPQLVDDFLSWIQPQSGRPAFYFLHILIPHIPYMYLPSGQHYSPPVVPDGLKGKKSFSDSYLADLAYQRYLLQVGYADRILGRVVDRLKAVDLYNESLVVVTADHGVSFTPGDPMRTLTSHNYTELLPVPLFVKVPNQEKGIRSEGNAETTDIVPTIGDVLDIKIPWKVDGCSMISPDFPNRAEKTIFNNGGGVLLDSVPMTSVTSFPLLDEQLQKYGQGTPLDDLRIRTEYGFLVGEEVKSLHTEKSEGCFVECDQAEVYRNDIDVSSPYLPLYITARIKRISHKEIIPNIAIAVNGRIEVVTRIIESLGDGSEIRVLLPKNALVDGQNRMEFFFIERRDDDSIILKKSGESTYALVSDYASDRLTIQTPAGRHITVSDGVVRSYYSMKQSESGVISFTGWAIDEKNEKPADSVLLFAGDRFVKKGAVGLERKDIVDWLGNKNYLKSGFSVTVPFDAVRYSEIRVYAVLNNGSGSEAAYYSQNPCLLAHEKWPYKIRALLFSGVRLDLSENGSSPVVFGEEGRAGVSEHIEGQVEQINESKSCVEFIGWAIDTRQVPPPKAELAVIDGRQKWVLDRDRVPPPKAVIVFQGESLICSGTITRPRPDIVEKYGNPDLLNAGFHFAVPKDSLDKGKISNVRLYIISDDNRVKELGLP